MKKHLLLHVLWGVWALVVTFQLSILLNPAAWPPLWWERRAQREQLDQRVEAAGGWQALKRDCIALAKTNDDVFQWLRGYTNINPLLPPAIAALQPKEVQFVSPKLLKGHLDEAQIPIVRIKIFGMHSTGGRSTPYFGLEVIAREVAADYVPKPRPAADGNGHRRYRKVTDGVYEVF